MVNNRETFIIIRIIGVRLTSAEKRRQEHAHNFLYIMAEWHALNFLTFILNDVDAKKIMNKLINDASE